MNRKTDYLKLVIGYAISSIKLFKVWRRNRIKLEQKRIFFFFNEFLATGAPITLIPLVEHMANQGWKVIAISPKGGELENSIRPFADVHVIRGLRHVSKTIFCKSVASADAVIINTLALTDLVKKLDGTQIKTIWWLHEAEYGFEAFIDTLPQKISSNIRIYTVSKYAQEVTHKYRPYWKTSIFTWAIEDKYTEIEDQISKRDKFAISIIGRFEFNKGQDILVDALSSLPPEHLKRTETKIIGMITDPAYFSNLEPAFSKLNISYIGALENRQALKAISESDLIVVPSRDESMSLVAVESLMLGKPVAVTNTCGVASLISNGQDGFTFNKEDYLQLSGIITDCMTGNTDLERISKEARSLYLKEFSFSRFLSQFDQIIA